MEIIKPPTVKRLPVILTTSEIERLLNKARKLRYYTILLTLYSMGSRLSEGLNLTTADIDSERMKVHLRNCKGGKDVTLTFPFVRSKRFDAIELPYLLPGHRKALRAIQLCRTPGSGMTLLECNGFGSRDHKPMSCEHRNCNRCQNTDISQWLERQRQKLLPVEYFMVTFTLPAQLHILAWQHQRTIYDLLFKIAADTLKAFGANSKNMDADLGMTGVLHTHSRRLDYHPHVHFVVPAEASTPAEMSGESSRGNTCSMARVWRQCFELNS